MKTFLQIKDRYDNDIIESMEPSEDKIWDELFNELFTPVKNNIFDIYLSFSNKYQIIRDFFDFFIEYYVFISWETYNEGFLWLKIFLMQLLRKLWSEIN